MFDYKILKFNLLLFAFNLKKFHTSNPIYLFGEDAVDVSHLSNMVCSIQKWIFGSQRQREHWETEQGEREPSRRAAWRRSETIVKKGCFLDVRITYHRFESEFWVLSPFEKIQKTGKWVPYKLSEVNISHRLSTWIYLSFRHKKRFFFVKIITLMLCIWWDQKCVIYWEFLEPNCQPLLATIDN